MIKTCQSCGAVNGEADNTCCFCDAPLGGRASAPVSRQFATQTEGNLAVEPDWRLEVSKKLRQYRARRSSVSAELQTVLPFEPDTQRPTEPADESPRMFAPEPEVPAMQKNRYRENDSTRKAGKACKEGTRSPHTSEREVRNRITSTGAVSRLKRVFRTWNLPLRLTGLRIAICIR